MQFSTIYCLCFKDYLALNLKDFCLPVSFKGLVKGSNPFPNKLWSTGLLKTLWEKEKLLVPSNFSFSHSVFYSFGELSGIFIKFEVVVCELLQFGRI